MAVILHINTYIYPTARDTYARIRVATVVMAREFPSMPRGRDEAHSTSLSTVARGKLRERGAQCDLSKKAPMRMPSIDCVHVCEGDRLRIRSSSCNTPLARCRAWFLVLYLTHANRASTLSLSVQYQQDGDCVGSHDLLLHGA
jgi:hypothetical protein